MTLQVRTADLDTAADGAAIVEVLDSYASDPRGGGVPLADDARARLLPGLRAHPTTLVLLAFKDSRPVGLAIGFFGFSSFEARPLLNIHDLAVSRSGPGVGRALLTAAESIAGARGCCRLTLEVQDDNLPARTLYERFGFRM